ncbi:hypothetical protein ACQP2Y_08980 [Actinoplanes sp. CA-051413]|uniref:hypothetical protein n=1 Tax=Actinoplanes sp. CA-051413 TaxID=3239899 RepID=UPI003D977222
MTSPFDDGPGQWTGPPLTGDMVRQAEATLGVRLPQAYVYLAATAQRRRAAGHASSDELPDVLGR